MESVGPDIVHQLQEPVARLREVRADLLVKLYFCGASAARQTAPLLDPQFGARCVYLECPSRLAV